MNLLTSDELARMLSVAPSTVIQWRRTGKGPPFVRLTTRTIRYRVADVEIWLGGESITEEKPSRRAEASKRMWAALTPEQRAGRIAKMRSTREARKRIVN